MIFGMHVKSFENYIKEQNQEVISFDFDDTINELQWDAEEGDYVRDNNGHIVGNLDKKIAKLIFKYHNDGKKVVIVTSRLDSAVDEIREFVKKHNLPIQEIYNTNMEPKLFTLERIKASTHYDDDIEEIRPLKSSGIKGIHIKRYDK